MKFIVSEELIKRGRKTVLRYKFCPVALAIKEEGFSNVEVFPTYAVINGTKHTLPLKVRGFIRRFDGNRNVRPFQFNLDISVD